MKIPNWIRKLVDRRKENKPVSQERRGRITRRKEADKRLFDAIDDLERTVSIRRHDIEMVASNDRQQVVIFSTFREICTSGVQVGLHRICRHPQHPAANTGMAICEEVVCPKLTVALKGAA